MIEVRGVNTHNKGAHLMMLAVAAAMSNDTKLTMSPNGAEFEDRSAAGFRQTVLLNQAPALTRVVGNALPRTVRDAYGLVRDRDITAVLDAAGFAYSDSFAPTRAKREAMLAAAWHKRGLPIVFLPQAFGPFRKREQKEWSRRLLTSSSLIYARDRVSMEYLGELGLSARIELAPDFTVGLDVSHIGEQIVGRYGAIVPNEKLVTQGKIAESDYVESLVAAAKQMRSLEIAPVVVIHEFNDRRIGEAVASAAGGKLFVSSNPLVLKKVLGGAEVAVASRFHAIVSALALNTPVAAFGWSHKYEELMNDFDVPEWAVSDHRALPDTVSALADGEASARARLAAAVTTVKLRNTEMWRDVRSVVLAEK